MYIEGNVYACTSIPTQINRICKLVHPPTVNTTAVSCNTTVSVKTNALTVFVPGAFYLIS
jgi:hypothetical protein